ncbi:hypothetical protein TIFTF001_040023 [Ficus carica]|uniref:Rx N-terminal domain-containing protein n=1 Tax=Ficus carica TaxID=3494 RepID=A0AA87Z8D5_FICCA|nr:hypothetical protein TIFTF001_040023 [Ficus carica]
MAESAVSFLVDKLTSLLTEEAKQLTGIREEVAFVKDELQSLKAFLQKADAVEDEDPEIKAWVKQVRKVAYDTKDLVDEFLQTFNLRYLLVKIIEQLFKGIWQQVPDETYSKDILSLKEDLFYFLGDKKYLVVLDDLWSLRGVFGVRFSGVRFRGCCIALVDANHADEAASFESIESFNSSWRVS